MTSSFYPPRRTLMGPGPSDVSPRVLGALARPTIGHLDPLFVQLMDEIKVALTETKVERSLDRLGSLAHAHRLARQHLLKHVGQLPLVPRTLPAARARTRSGARTPAGRRAERPAKAEDLALNFLQLRREPIPLPLQRREPALPTLELLRQVVDRDPAELRGPPRTPRRLLRCLLLPTCLLRHESLSRKECKTRTAPMKQNQYEFRSL